MANGIDGTVSIIDAHRNLVTKNVNVGDGPSCIVINPAGSRVYVANEDDDTISVIDTKESNSVITISEVGDGPTAVVVNNPESRIYVSNTNDDTVSVIDAGNFSVVATVNG